MRKRVFSLFVAGTMIIGLTGCGNYELSPSEAVAWTRLRLVIAESAYSGQKSTLTAEQVDVLKQVAQSKGGDWFDDLSYYAYGKTKDTDQYEITSICDDDYCATFKMKDYGTRYQLVEYTFEPSYERGYRIEITEE